MLSETDVARLRTPLVRLYGDGPGTRVLPRFVRLIEDHGNRQAPGRRGPDETDVLLSCYPDQISEPARPTLATLHDVLTEWVRPGVTGLHLLPVHPSSSDEGFAVADYEQVAPTYGGWEHIRRLGGDYGLMLDAVVNHTSAAHPWCTGWLADDPRYRNFYVAVDPSTDLGSVTRPRTSPLLTELAPGRWAWTTFSPDQVDLDYANPEVLLRVTEVLLSYVASGARFLRLDAVAFLWKRVGTPSVHLPETHAIVRFWRTVLDLAAPGTLLVTETNVPHNENVSYFGSGSDEAHLVYQFPLPPLVLAAFHTGQIGPLAAWLRTLETPTRETTFLNFLASHDGIGLRAAEGLLSATEIESLCAAVRTNGGLVSLREVGAGQRVPYELNVVYLDALGPPGTHEALDRVVDRLLAAHSIMFALAGVPMVWFHSLFGSRNWPQGPTLTGQARSVNRQRLLRADLERDLSDQTGLRRRVLDRLLHMIRVRAGNPAFHPQAAQSWVPGSVGHVALQRAAPEGRRTAVCVADVTGRPGRFRGRPPDRVPGGTLLRDLLDGSEHLVEVDGVVDVPISGYGVRWLSTPDDRMSAPQS